VSILVQILPTVKKDRAWGQGSVKAGHRKPQAMEFPPLVGAEDRLSRDWQGVGPPRHPPQALAVDFDKPLNLALLEILGDLVYNQGAGVRS